MRRRVVNVETVRVAKGTPSVTRRGRVPAPPKGAPCEVAPKAQIKPGERVVVEAMREALCHNSGKVAALELIIEAQQKEIEGLRAALRNELVPLKVQEDPWRRFREDPPEPGQLIAIAVLQIDKKSWSYSAEITDRDSIEYWQMVKYDVRWMPLQEVEA